MIELAAIATATELKRNVDMNLEGADALAFLTGKNSLLDSRLISFHVLERGDAVSVDMTFLGRAGADYKQVKLSFDFVTEVSFAHSRGYAFGNVETVKFILTGESEFYLALDPDPLTKRPSPVDGDVVRARNLSATTS